jgi:hypothetical protein
MSTNSTSVHVITFLCVFLFNLSILPSPYQSGHCRHTPFQEIWGILVKCPYVATGGQMPLNWTKNWFKDKHHVVNLGIRWSKSWNKTDQWSRAAASRRANGNKVMLSHESYLFSNLRLRHAKIPHYVNHSIVSQQHLENIRASQILTKICNE